MDKATPKLQEQLTVLLLTKTEVQRIGVGIIPEKMPRFS
jgi:hypothetical protein